MLQKRFSYTYLSTYLPQSSTVGPWATLPQAMLSLNQRWFHLVSKIFDLRYFFYIFLEQHWFKGQKISVAQGKCRKNSIDQIFLKLNGISVDSRTALLKVALLKKLLYIYNTSLEINRVVWSLCSLYQKKIPILPPLWEKSGHLTVHEKKIESPKQWILKGGMYIYILLLIST